MVLLSFDIEEFDLPIEYGQSIDMSEQMRISEQGLSRILDVLDAEGVPATFYSTAVFMRELSGHLRERLLASEHEIASHGVSHSSFAPEHYQASKVELEMLTARPIRGFRMARMQPTDEILLLRAGYVYDSSMHPTYLPGRYNYWSEPRLPHRSKMGLWLLPASVLPYVRFPLFWLSMHNLPLSLYQRLMHYTARKDGYLNTYYHPWEFADLRQEPYNLPSYIVRNSGRVLQNRLRVLIQYLKRQGHHFGTTSQFLSI